MLTLLDGSSVDSDFLRFDPEHYHFYLGTGADAQDLTDLIRRSDKEALIENFDVEKENERIYVEKYFREHGKLPPDIGSDSVWWNFQDQILTDPLKAGVDATASFLGGTTTGNVLLLGAALWLWMTYGKKR